MNRSGTLGKLAALAIVGGVAKALFGEPLVINRYYHHVPEQEPEVVDATVVD